MTGVKPRPGPDRQLTRQAVLDAALAIVDSDGLAALNARRLGAELGVGSATPYRYFETRDRLIDAMIGHALTPEPDAEGELDDWRAKIEVLARSIRADFLLHPGALEIVMTRPSGDPALDPWRERIFGVLRAAGFSDRLVVEAGGAIFGLVFGSVMMHGFRDAPGAAHERIRKLSPEVWPNLVAVAPAYGRHHGGPQSFDFALEQVVAAYERLL